MNNNLNIVIAQLDFLVGDIHGNAQKIIQTTKKISEQYAADLIVFPELSLTGYPPEDLLLRPGLYTRCQEALIEIKKNTIHTRILIGYPEKIEGHYYNQASLIYEGKIQATYSKQELPNYTVFDEKRYFSPGKLPCIIEINNIAIGIVICEDLWFPAAASQTLKAGAQLIVSLNASPYDRNKVKARENMLMQRVKEIHIPIIYANCVGGQDELVFDGGSMVINAEGERCQQAAYYQEDIVLIECVINDKKVDIKKQPLPPRLSEEENIYQALVLGVRDYINKNEFPGAIIGLSGGIDSALTLAIAVDAIGANRVRAVMMPTRFTSTMSTEDAKKQAEKQKVSYKIITIEPIFNTFLNELHPHFSDHHPNSTEENLQARIRGTTLMALSNNTGAIVLTTGNKSEISVGYTTLYGDMAGGFNVLKDIPKTLVYRLAHYRNSISPVIPERVIDRPPSAELAFDQKDEDTLPPYPILDDILDRYIEKDQDPVSIYAAGFDKNTVDKVVQLINRNEYKRRQAPIGIRITQRAFGKDRRYPITSGYL